MHERGSGCSTCRGTGIIVDHHDKCNVEDVVGLDPWVYHCQDCHRYDNDDESANAFRDITGFQLSRDGFSRDGLRDGLYYVPAISVEIAYRRLTEEKKPSSQPSIDNIY